MFFKFEKNKNKEMYGYALRHPHIQAKMGIVNKAGFTPLTLSCRLGPKNFGAILTSPVRPIRSTLSTLSFRTDAAVRFIKFQL